MDTEGFIFLDRVAVATDIKTGERISKTYEGVDGLFFQERVANTQDHKSGKHTHKTKNVKKGLIFQRIVTETTNLEQENNKKTITEAKKRGFIFQKNYLKTDKD
jgi:predicted GIY-YIG superfamily endonuclease